MSGPRQGETIDGVMHMDISDWSEFQSVVHGQFPFIYRGQRWHDWLLLSRIDRVVEVNRSVKNMDVDALRRFLIEQQLESFLRVTRGMLAGIRETLGEPEDWWHLGQHYGLATPLLDWTESPYVAAFFAFAEEPDPFMLARNSSLRRAVFALSGAAFGREPSLAKALKVEGLPFRHYIKRVDPITDHNPRLVNQAGLFTKVTNGRDIAHTVRGQYKGVTQQPALIEMTFPEEMRKEVIGRLDVMNVSYKTLFPDLEGAAKFCNTMLGIR